MNFVTNTKDLMNYEIQTSNSNNYGSPEQTPSANSFPSLMENGIIVKYELVKFSAEMVDENKLPKEQSQAE
jgi:hypothetical protein